MGQAGFTRGHGVGVRNGGPALLEAILNVSMFSALRRTSYGWTSLALWNIWDDLAVWSTSKIPIIIEYSHGIFGLGPYCPDDWNKTRHLEFQLNRTFEWINNSKPGATPKNATV